jgi:hypothetical protein
LQLTICRVAASQACAYALGFAHTTIPRINQHGRNNL